MRLRIPDGARVAARFDASYSDWTLYERPLPDTSSFLWLPFKLMRAQTARKRRGVYRAFRLHWHPVEQRMRRDRDAGRLLRQDPALHARVCLFLELTYTRTWLLDTGGVTAAEIEAEVARLAGLAGQRAGG
jgi:hypothetical protein